MEGFYEVCPFHLAIANGPTGQHGSHKSCSDNVGIKFRGH